MTTSLRLGTDLENRITNEESKADRARNGRKRRAGARQQEDNFKLEICPHEKGQATKGARGMPWHQEPKKDVTSCDKLRGGAHIRYIRRFPNGETRQSNTLSAYVEYIGVCGEPPELKHLSRARKRNQPRFRK